jgi:hypothetical protein
MAFSIEKYHQSRHVANVNIEGSSPFARLLSNYFIKGYSDGVLRHNELVPDENHRERSTKIRLIDASRFELSFDFSGHTQFASNF